MAGLSCITKESWDDAEWFTERKNAPISGQHRFDGIFALSSPGLAKGKWLEGMHIQDTAPTLLYAVDEAVPAWMDGDIRGDIYENPQEPKIDHSPEPVNDFDTGSSSDNSLQDKEIEESLRGLGYLQ